MAGIIDNSDNTFKRVEMAITRVLNAADGYRLYIDSSTDTTIADVVAASGVVTLPAPYAPGRFNLQIVVNGLIRSNVGASLVTNDYVELNNTQFQFGNDILAVLTANQATSNIEIRWNRHWPGVRDALFSNLQNISTDMEGAVLNSSSPSAANPFLTGDTDDQAAIDGANAPSAGNVFATIADIPAGSSGSTLKGFVAIIGGGTYSAGTGCTSYLFIPGTTNTSGPGQTASGAMMVTTGNIAYGAVTNGADFGGANLFYNGSALTPGISQISYGWSGAAPTILTWNGAAANNFSVLASGNCQHLILGFGP